LVRLTKFKTALCRPADKVAAMSAKLARTVTWPSGCMMPEDGESEIHSASHSAAHSRGSEPVLRSV
jgi:hypothetical protein